KARARDDPLAGRGIAPRLEGARDRAARRVRLLGANPAVGLATGEVQPHGRKVVEVLREGARRSPVDACEARARLEARREPAAAGAREAALESRWPEAQRGAAERGERPPLRARPEAEKARLGEKAIERHGPRAGAAHAVVREDEHGRARRRRVKEAREGAVDRAVDEPERVAER